MLPFWQVSNLAKDRKLNNLHSLIVGSASRPFFLDGRDAHPTITIKIVSYLILIPKRTPISCGFKSACRYLY
jgi:hypothetical protein